MKRAITCWPKGWVAIATMEAIAMAYRIRPKSPAEKAAARTNETPNPRTLATAAPVESNAEPLRRVQSRPCSLRATFLVGKPRTMLPLR